MIAIVCNSSIRFFWESAKIEWMRRRTATGTTAAHFGPIWPEVAIFLNVHNVPPVHFKTMAGRDKETRQTAFETVCRVYELFRYFP
jgi:hypothetical protein